MLKWLFFSKITRLVRQGLEQRYLEIQDLFAIELKNNRIQDFHRNFLFNLNNTKSQFRYLTLIKVFIKTYPLFFAVITFLQILLTALLYVTPLLTDKILTLVKQKHHNQNILIILVLICLQKGFKSLLNVHLGYAQYTIGTNFYSQLVNQIFIKAYQRGTYIEGKVLNLMEDDCYRIINFPFFMFAMVFGPIQLIFGIGLFIWTLGIQFFLYDLYIFLVYLVICCCIVAMDFRWNRQLMKKKDLRLRATFQFTNQPYNQQIKSKCLRARQQELSQQKKLFGVDIFSKTIANIGYATMVCTVFLRINQSSNFELFTVLLLFSELRYPFLQLPQTISNFIQNLVSIGRIQDYLLCQVIETQQLLSQQLINQSVSTEQDRQPYIQSYKTVFQNIVFYGKYQDRKVNKLIFDLKINPKQRLGVELSPQQKLLVELGRAICHKNLFNINKVLQQLHITESQYIHMINQFQVKDTEGSLEVTYCESKSPEEIQINSSLEGKVKGNVKLKYYLQYFKFSNSIYLMVVFVVCCVSTQVLSVWNSILVKQATKHRPFRFQIQSIQFASYYLSVIPTVISLIIIFSTSIKSSRNSFRQIMHLHFIKSMSITLNRLSNDIKFYDKNFATNVVDLLTSVLSILSNIVLCIAALATTWWVALIIAIVIVVFGLMLWLNRAFMWSRRQCARLEGMSRSPLLAHFCETVSNKEQIQNYAAQKFVHNEMIQLINNTARLHLMGIYMQQWFEARLLLLSCVVSISMALLTYFVNTDVTVTGLILSYTLSLDDLFKSLFLNIVSFEKTAVCVQRYLSLMN